MKNILILLILLFFFQAISAQKYTFQAPKWGSIVQITVADQDSSVALEAAELVFAIYDTLNQILSDYLPDSELNLLCRKAGTGEWTTVSPHLLRMLQLSQIGYQQSKGTFDPSIGRVVQLWRKARKEKTFPNKKALSEALQTVGFELGKDIEIIGNQVRLNRKNVQLDFGGIAQGYAAQCGLDSLKKRGINAVLIDSSGDLIIGDAPKGSKGWRITINKPNNPDETLPYYFELANCAVATSGSLYQFVELNGKRYSHIVNPKTGIGLTHQRNVTVIAKDGTTADWMTKACSVPSIRKAKKFIQKQNKGIINPAAQSKLLITYWHKGKIKTEKVGDFQAISIN
jgi:FAD:protein FMN transferase